MLTTLSLLHLFTRPDAPASNLFESDPGYDEGRGPRSPHNFLLGEDDEYVPLDEVPEEEGFNRFVTVAVEDTEERERRLLWADIDDPRAYGETNQDVMAAIQQQSKDYLLPDDEPLLTVDPTYHPYLPPAPTAVRNFSRKDEDIGSGVVQIRVRVLDKKKGRIVPKKCAIPVIVRAKKRY